MPLTAHLEISNPFQERTESPRLLPLLLHHTSRDSSSLNSASTPLPSPRPVTHEPESLSAGAISLEFLENIQRVEINEICVHDGETFFVLDIFLYHFNTRLPTNLTYLRRAAHSTSSSSSVSTTTGEENITPDYRVKRRFIDFCDLRHQVYDAACLNPHIRCASCDEFIIYVRFKLRQPRPVMHLMTTGRVAARRAILAAFVNDFLHMALCREKQNHKCESHRFVSQYLEAFLRDPRSSETNSSRLSW